MTRLATFTAFKDAARLEASGTTSVWLREDRHLHVDFSEGRFSFWVGAHELTEEQAAAIFDRKKMRA